MKTISIPIFLFVHFLVIVNGYDNAVLDEEVSRKLHKTNEELMKNKIDACESNPCKNGGICKTAGDTFKCQCKENFGGDQCELECKCKNGNCIRAPSGKIICGCQPEFGVYETDKETVCKACFCGKKANCTFTSGYIFKDYYCLCPNVVRKNEACDDPCKKNPCENGGTCQSEDVFSFNCTCANGYSGKFCERVYDPCKPNPCQNGGTCKADGNNFKCECKDHYKGDKCDIAKTGCEEFGGKEECEGKGDYFTCINDGKDQYKYICVCLNGYKMNNEKCIAETGCDDYGGNQECQGKGELFICINIYDKQNVSMYSCDCLPGYKLINEKCIAKTGCEDYGGNQECQGKGELFICINQKQNISKYLCDCLPGYKLYYEKCIEIEAEYTTDYSPFTDWSDPTYITAGVCDCGRHSVACYLDYKGNKMCLCKAGYAQMFDTCTETCKYDRECLNGGICKMSHGGVGFCECRADYSGDRCETNDVCRQFEDICQRYGAVCVIKESLPSCECPSDKKDISGLCESICNPNKCIHGRCKIYGQDFKCRCEVGYEGKYCDTEIFSSKRDWFFCFLLITSIVFIVIFGIGVFCMMLYFRSKKVAVATDLEKLITKTTME